MVITEIGGTVGDYESLPYIEAVRQLKWEMGKNILVYGKVDPVEEIYRKIDAITSSGLATMANEVFNPADLSSLIFNNQKPVSR